MKPTLLTAVQKRFTDWEQNPLFSTAALLDPTNNYLILSMLLSMVLDSVSANTKIMYSHSV